MSRGEALVRVPIKVLRLASRFKPDAVWFSAGRDARNRVAITFDDGPHPEVTPRILEILANANAAATFFFQGDNARRWPSLVLEAHAAGHEIGSHGMHHVSALRQNGGGVLDNAAQCHAVLTEITGAPLARNYRPPYGDMTLNGFRALRAHGYRLIYWSYDSDDSFMGDGESLRLKLSRDPPVAGSIVLFHDDCVHTARALPAALTAWRHDGLSFTTVTELCAR